MLDYLIIDLLILFPVLLMSLKWEFDYFYYIKPLFKSILIVGTSYIIWDIIVTKIGHWSFSHEKVIGIRFFWFTIRRNPFFYICTLFLHFYI